MPLADGQVSVRDLVMGRDTVYRMLADFNPWLRQARADQTGPRAWNHGAWSGAEWMAEAAVPLRIAVIGDTPADWLTAHQALMAAFAPSHESIELRFVHGGTEYLMLGRPRVVEPETRTVAAGVVLTNAAFMATDPLIYSGTEHSAETGLPVSTGGLTLPTEVPFSIGATVEVGRVAISNAGTAPTGLRLTITGPVDTPRVALLTDDGTYTLTINLTLSASEFLEIDTAARTVYLQGTASRRGFASASDLGWPVLPPGDAELAFFAEAFEADALLEVAWRDAWY